jgi:hypothetical protein
VPQQAMSEFDLEMGVVADEEWKLFDHRDEHNRARRAEQLALADQIERTARSAATKAMMNSEGPKKKAIWGQWDKFVEVGKKQGAVCSCCENITMLPLGFVIIFTLSISLSTLPVTIFRASSA